MSEEQETTETAKDNNEAVAKVKVGDAVNQPTGDATAKEKPKLSSRATTIKWSLISIFGAI